MTLYLPQNLHALSKGNKHRLQAISPSAGCWNCGTASGIMEQRNTFEEISTGDGCDDCGGGDDKKYLILVP